MIKVKICGITNLEDAVSSIEAGTDALGFVFYKKSPRYITPEEASRIIKELPAHIIKIGVFANAKEKVIRRIAKFCSLDILQFHGNESAEFCRRFGGYKIIKVIRIKDRIDLKNMLKYKPFAYLFDTYTKLKLGGSGKNFNWKLVSPLARVGRPIFLSGGLTAKNVKEAIKAACPDWVDVSSSVEITPGKKDREKVKDFIREAKGN